jgi:hypothetical protein
MGPHPLRLLCGCIYGWSVEPHYAALKAALLRLIHSLAGALAPHGVIVNALAPAMSVGGETLPGNETQLHQYAAHIPVGLLGKPEEVAEAGFSLIANPFLTAQTLLIDGGAVSSSRIDILRGLEGLLLLRKDHLSTNAQLTMMESVERRIDTKQHQLGQGLFVSEMGLGTMGMTSYYGTAASEQDALHVIHRTLDLGVTLIDAAEAYGPFTNEELVG